MVWRLGRVDVRVGHIGTETGQLDLLGEAACTAHDSCEKARVANFPELKGQVDCAITRQIVSFRVEAEAGYVLGVAFEDLPFGGGAHVVDTNRAVVRAHSQSLRVVVEGHHWEDFNHV